MDGIRRELGMNDEMIRQAEQDWVSHNDVMIKIKFNRGKKINTDTFAELSFKPADIQAVDTVEQEFHYGLFILGTEKHESRRIDNQLR